MARQFHRPARLDPEAAEQIEGSADTAVASELAHRAAQALIGGFPGTEDGDDPITRSSIVTAVATNGVDDIAELWADSPATTLPGALWRLFLVREWIRRDPSSSPAATPPSSTSPRPTKPPPPASSPPSARRAPCSPLPTCASASMPSWPAASRAQSPRSPHC